MIGRVRRLPPQNFHGKEGVDGSSPSEGLHKALQMGMQCCLRWRDVDASRVPDGYILELAITRGARVTSRGPVSDVPSTPGRDHRQGKFLQADHFVLPMLAPR